MQLSKNKQKVHRLYELETGILKICTAIELLQKTICKEELEVTCQSLLKPVQNCPPVDNYTNRIEFLERKLDQAAMCLESINSNSKRLKLLCLYITALRYGNNSLRGGLPMKK